jgi:YebC/PmpR family DNA-binding regulatory protein
VADKARQFNMPKDNIARAIEHGMGAGKGAELAEVVYEGFLPGGCAVMIDVLTDNKARTVQQVRMILEKSGGNLAGSGSVSYLFKPLGEIRVKTVSSSIKSIQEQELAIIDLGIDEIETDGEFFDIYCNKDKTYEFKEELEKMGYQVESAQLVMKPDAMVEIADKEGQQRVEQTIESMEELDDVTRVWSNYQPGDI